MSRKWNSLTLTFDILTKVKLVKSCLTLVKQSNLTFWLVKIPVWLVKMTFWLFDKSTWLFDKSSLTIWPVKMTVWQVFWHFDKSKYLFDILTSQSISLTSQNTSLTSQNTSLTSQNTSLTSQNVKKSKSQEVKWGLTSLDFSQSQMEFDTCQALTKVIQTYCFWLKGGFEPKSNTAVLFFPQG